jgi:hypothetical protein
MEWVAIGHKPLTRSTHDGYPADLLSAKLGRKNRLVTSPISAAGGLGPAGPKRQQRGIQLPQLLLSLLVVAVFALLAVWWQASTTSRKPVLALASDVTQGEPLRLDQMTEIFISSDVPANVQPASDASIFVGARPVSNMSAGTLITTEMFVAGAELAPGQAFVGLMLGGTRAPTGIVAGDRVQILVAVAGDGEVDLVSPDALVESATYDGRTLVVRLRLDVTSAQRVQLLAEEVVLIEVDNSGQASWSGDGS